MSTFESEALQLIPKYYTTEQKEAVTTTGNNILVSASAGSGKTMVLTSRVLYQLVRGRGIDEFLIVTFTNAAALEMKERIQKEIRKSINKLDNHQLRTHFLQQNMKMAQANISTLHSFCLKVIERYYYLIDFDPTFRQLTDEVEIALIKEDVWNDLFEELLAEEYGHYRSLFLNYGGKRSEDLFEIVSRLLNYSLAQPNPVEWLKSLPDFYPAENILESELFQELIRPQLARAITYSKEQMAEAKAQMYLPDELKVANNIINKEYDHYSKTIAQLNDPAVKIDSGFIEKMLAFTFDRWSSGSGDAEELGKALKVYRDAAKDNYTDNVRDKYFKLSVREQEEMVNYLKGQVKLLSELTLTFFERYQAYKNDKKLVDFNDLEHLTIKILKTDRNQYSEAAKYYHRTIKEVMVDEYQDTNAVQEEILQLITRQHPEIIPDVPEDEVPSSYMYMVGDVKQSIYRFRLADPKLFQMKYRQYKKGKGGQLITLAKNFRSRSEVLTFTNDVFNQVMTEESGMIDYHDQALEYGFTDYPAPDSTPQLQPEFITYADKDERHSKKAKHLTTSEKNGHLIAERIIEMLADDEFLIYDKKTEADRRAQLSDFAILVRRNNVAQELKETLATHQLPATVNNAENFLQTTEIGTVLSLLKIIDNPYQDIPFVAVLRSPIVDLTDRELALIRIQDKQVDFYSVFLKFLKTSFEDPVNIELQKKLIAFNEQLEKWRSLARKSSVSQLIRVIYQDTRYNDYVLGLYSGQQRHANLQALYERAAAYEKTGFKGLFRFIRFIEKIQEADHDLAESPVASGEGGAINILTVHGSKGLEFPVVFLADLERKISSGRSSGSYVLNAELGIGLSYYNYEKREKFTSPWPKLAMTNINVEEDLEEEMRVLYVALTRAEQKLVLVGAISDEQEEILEGQEKTKLTTTDVLHAKSYMDWLTPVFNQNKETSYVELKSFSDEYLEQLLELRYLASEDQQIQSTEEMVPEDRDLLNATLERAEKIVTHTYDHPAATITTSSQSVSEIKRLFEDPEIGQSERLDLSQSDLKATGRYVADTFKRPQFMQDQTEPTAAEIGEATHLMMQQLDFSRPITESEINDQIQSLVMDEMLSQKLADHILQEEIVNFFETEFGQFIITHHQQLKRETPFSLMIDASEIFDSFKLGEDSVLVKGVIDGFIETDDGIVLFDYKTDRVAHYPDPEKVIRNRYSGQLNLYKRALELSTGCSVIDTRLILLETGEAVSISDKERKDVTNVVES